MGSPFQRISGQRRAAQKANRAKYEKQQASLLELKRKNTVAYAESIAIRTELKSLANSRNPEIEIEKLSQRITTLSEMGGMSKTISDLLLETLVSEKTRIDSRE